MNVTGIIVIIIVCSILVGNLFIDKITRAFNINSIIEGGNGVSSKMTTFRLIVIIILCFSTGGMYLWKVFSNIKSLNKQSMIIIIVNSLFTIGAFIYKIFYHSVSSENGDDSFKDNLAKTIIYSFVKIILNISFLLFMDGYLKSSTNENFENENANENKKEKINENDKNKVLDEIKNIKKKIQDILGNDKKITKEDINEFKIDFDNLNTTLDDINVIDNINVKYLNNNNSNNDYNNDTNDNSNDNTNSNANDNTGDTNIKDALIDLERWFKKIEPFGDEIKKIYNEIVEMLEQKTSKDVFENYENSGNNGSDGDNKEKLFGTNGIDWHNIALLPLSLYFLSEFIAYLYGAGAPLLFTTFRCGNELINAMTEYDDKGYIFKDKNIKKYGGMENSEWKKRLSYFGMFCGQAFSLFNFALDAPLLMLFSGIVPKTKYDKNIQNKKLRKFDEWIMNPLIEILSFSLDNIIIDNIKNNVLSSGYLKSKCTLFIMWCYLLLLVPMIFNLTNVYALSVILFIFVIVPIMYIRKGIMSKVIGLILGLILIYLIIGYFSDSKWTLVVMMYTIATIFGLIFRKLENKYVKLWKLAPTNYFKNIESIRFWLSKT